MVERPCIRCKTKTKALKNGVLRDHPICSTCSEEFVKEFNEATAQRKRQELR